MNHLVVVCLDNQFSLLAAAAALPADQREPLRDVARRRTAFSRERATQVGELGGTPARSVP
jgi:hypothetical protein